MNPVPFNRQNYQKEKTSGTSDQSLFRLRNKLSKIPLLVMYYLIRFDDVMQSNFWVILKFMSENLCKTIYDVINYSTSICIFESRKCGKKGKGLQKCEYLENEKSFLDEMKNIFNSFWRLIIWWKNKNLIKKADPSFKYFITLSCCFCSYPCFYYKCVSDCWMDMCSCLKTIFWNAYAAVTTIRIIGRLVS